METQKTHRINFNLDLDKVRDLKILCAKKRTTVSKLLKKHIDELLEKQSQ